MVISAIRAGAIRALAVIVCMGAAWTGAAQQHSADTNGDNAVSLSELLRVIQVYNSAGYHCADPPGSTEDGYVPGFDAGAQGCAPHDSDYNPQDWAVVLSELLRLIQFYNSGGYHALCGTEDEFAPGAAAPQPCDPEGEGEGMPEGEGAPEGEGEGGEGEGMPEGEGEGAPEGEGEGTPEGEGEGAPEGEGEGAPEGEGEGTPEGEGEGTPEGEGEGEGMPEGEGEGAPEGEGEGTPEGEGEGTPEGEGEGEGMPEGEGEGAPEGEGEGTPEGEGEGAPEGEGEGAPEGEGEGAPEGEGEGAAGPFTLNYFVSGSGSLVGEVTQTVAAGGNGTPVTVVANPGHAFTRWSDDRVDNPRVDEDVQADLTVTAEIVYEVTVSYLAGPNGAIVGAAAQTIPAGGATQPVSAQADAGFFFLKWSDGRLNNPRSDDGVLSDLTVTAEFAPESAALPVALIFVPSGEFPMGDPADELFAALPVHDVSLGGYAIGRYEVTKQQFAEVLNWAIAPERNLLRDENGDLWSGIGDIHGGDDLRKVLRLTEPNCDIEYTGGQFQARDRFGWPAPATIHSMASHPVNQVTWYGAALFCNWLSEMEGLDPVYDTSDWSADFSASGYHLPTEAQWERAAAWDGTKAWRFGFGSDTLSGSGRVNHTLPSFERVNPLQLFELDVAPTSPVGWFNGQNVSPNGDVQTVDSPSPVGAYDMSGNVGEWCHDWYSATWYSDGGPPWVDPTGPAGGIERVLRGGSFAGFAGFQRVADRVRDDPASASADRGFRVAR